ncbi:8-amino-7-oxononanoate synthase [Candidatus Marinamargulisbacteria bacterium SCGC AAA071-K20]|nr:8-amino-7-oxononanoate synthase [Candidatus Marinamargulisbacteria bacterium SCGC AAA071-K20]
MSSFDDQLSELKANSLFRDCPLLDESGIQFSSNDYLGLSKHPQLLDTVKNAITKFGFGSTGSRLLSGNHGLFAELEKKCARLLGKPSALFFNSGYQANIGVISALLNKADVVFADKFCHSSIINGISLSKAKLFRYKHLDYSHLDQLLTTHRKQFKNALIISEGLFSMDGDFSDMKVLCQLKQKHKSFLMMDDAHSIGLFEQGRGSSFDYAESVDLIIAPFGKALGSYGAAVGCSEEIRSYLINKAASFIYSTALPLPVIQFNIACLDLLPSLDKEREMLWSNTEFFRNMLATLSLKVLGESNIVPICFERLEDTLNCSNKLEAAGTVALPIRPPTVHPSNTRVRFSVCSWHTKSQLEAVCDVLRP